MPLRRLPPACIASAILLLATPMLRPQQPPPSTVSSPSTVSPPSAAATPPPILQQPTDTTFDLALQNGIAAFNTLNFAAATDHLRQALLFNPTSTSTAFYLGRTYAAQVVPNLDTPVNQAFADNAIDTLRSIPSTAPEFLPALQIIATAQHNARRLDEARRTLLQILTLAPADPDAHYTLGVLDWQQSYANAVALLAAAGLQDDGLGNPQLPPAACADLVARNNALVEDGLTHLQQAVALRPAFDDAMQYLNLTCRRRADLACTDPTRRAADLAQAEQWSTRAQQTRQPSPPPAP